MRGNYRRSLQRSLWFYSEDTKEGQRILERIRDYKAQLIMRKKGDPYLEEKDWGKIKNKDEQVLQAKMQARAILYPEKKA
jgi:hypothetical protein